MKQPSNQLFRQLHLAQGGRVAPLKQKDKQCPAQQQDSCHHQNNAGVQQQLFPPAPVEQVVPHNKPKAAKNDEGYNGKLYHPVVRIVGKGTKLFLKAQYIEPGIAKGRNC